ncbi:MAG: ADP-forming succinate--CoA ligase subunit beta [Gammaproteobacteria bacterium]|nr:ADP-forming succinate--CoA ligase subunit beta [Gammaproteobacteria bacterium]
MNIHEYQAKALLAQFGAAVPQGEAAFTPEEADAAIERLPGPVWVVKAQIHAGGRGKGGGVKVADSREKAKRAAREILGMTLVTKQTGDKGKVVRRVYIENGCDIARELYLALALDRARGRVSVIASREGGMEIEEVAAKSPEKIVKQHIDPVLGMRPFHARRIAFALGLNEQAREAEKLLGALYRAFTELDASLLELNPLVVTKSGGLMALDAKMRFDDNALFRRPKIAELRDRGEEDAAESEAAEIGLSYIKLDGEIGCMVNGAGLAMATMDIIKLHGGEPANFLDVGGGADAERVAAAFKIILSDKNVRAVLVNIFGGIMRCDVIAEGIVAAARELKLNDNAKAPLVVRLEGTNVEQGKKLLAESGLAITAADDFDDAAKKAVAAAKKSAN